MAWRAEPELLQHGHQREEWPEGRRVLKKGVNSFGRFCDEGLAFPLAFFMGPGPPS